MTIKKRKILSATLLAWLAMAVSYFCTNLNVAVSGERDVLKYWQFVVSLFSNNSRNQVPEDVLFINVSNDRQLVDRTDDFGIPIGNAAITDRQKIGDLLMLIKSEGRYNLLLSTWDRDESISANGKTINVVSAKNWLLKQS